MKKLSLHKFLSVFVFQKTSKKHSIERKNSNAEKQTDQWSEEQCLPTAEIDDCNCQ